MDRLVVNYCSPTLAGIKSAGLFNCVCEGDIYEKVETYNQKWQDKGIKMQVIRRNEKSALIYVYREKMLEKDLSDKVARDLLTEYGYTDKTVQGAVNRLALRTQTQKDFPHEIGLFLGYPAKDVRSFIENNGKNYQCSGEWKVYHDPTNAQKIFKKHKKCKQVYTELFQKGFAIDKLTIAKDF